jgi:hypothetical protein
MIERLHSHVAVAELREWVIGNFDMTLDNLTVDPGEIDPDSLLAEWRWLVGPVTTPVLITALGDLFLRNEKGAILHLDTCSGLLSQVAGSNIEFRSLLARGDFVDKWFSPQFIVQLKADGMDLSPGQCYGYKLPPVVGGSTELSNMEPTNLLLHFGLLGQLHRGVKNLPDGTPIRRFIST